MRSHEQVNVIVYYPKSEEDKEALTRRVAEVHCDTVNRRIRELKCPNAQKLQLLDGLIEDARKRCKGGQAYVSPKK